MPRDIEADIPLCGELDPDLFGCIGAGKLSSEPSSSSPGN